MFNPAAAREKEQTNAAKRAIRSWVQDALPPEIAATVESISVQEFQCGDPSCSPIDTGIFIMIKGGETLQQGIPKHPKDVTETEVALTVSDMLNPETLLPPLGPRPAMALQAVMSTVQAHVRGMSYSEKMALFSHLFSTIEAMETATMEDERSKVATRNSRTNEANAILSKAQQNDGPGIQALLDGGADPSMGNSVGQTALHVAVLWGNADACRVLIDGGAALDATNSLTGGTPMHVLVASPKAVEGRLECLQQLLSAGADVTIQDSRSHTPLQAAMAGPNEAPIVELLQDAERRRTAGAAASY